MLGDKKQYTNDYFLNLYSNAKHLMPKYKVIEIEQKTISEIKKIASRYGKICLGYTAGKDSVVLQRLFEKSGVQFYPVMWITEMQYPSTMEWIRCNAPQGLKLVDIKRPTYYDLENDNDLLFCKTPDANNWWMSKKWQAQKAYLKDNKFDLFVVGRRKGDGNNCGKKENFYVRKANDYDVYSPIAEWKVEEIFAYMGAEGLTLPRNYLYQDGFINGSGAWAERYSYGYRQYAEDEQWQILFDNEKEVVIEASKHLQSAKRFLSNKEIRE